MKHSIPVVAFLFVFGLSAPSADVRAETMQPLALTEAERAAVGLAIAYLEGGADAWWDRLAPEAPLQSLGRAKAVAEIAVRCGPPRGARWQLHTPPPGAPAGTAVFVVELPSGIDEHLRLGLVERGGEWKIRTLVSLSDPAPSGQGFLADASVVELGEYLELRRSLAGGGAERQAPSRATAADGLADEVAQLWEAQSLLVRQDLNQAAAILARLPDAHRLPLHSLLTGRLAFLRSQRESAFEAYDRLARHTMNHDGLRLEAAGVLAALGFLGDSEVRFTQLGEMGSRLADVHYNLARFAFLSRDEDRAVRHLTTAWDLRPIPRETLFKSPILAYLSVRPTFLPRIAMSSSREPVHKNGAPRRPLAELARFEGRLLGGELTVEVAGATLVVPNGVVLAPADTPLQDSAAEVRREEAHALSNLAALRAAGPGVLTQPQRRRELELAALALGRGRRWNEVVQLTEGLGPSVVQAPPAVVQLRAHGLMEEGRDGEAHELLVALAQNDLKNRRRDPTTFYQLAELVADAEQYDLAIRLIEKASSLSPLGGGDVRVRQLEMEKRLAESFQTYRSAHFDIRYPASAGETFPAAMSVVLEAERERLRRYVPVDEKARVEVDLFPLKEFMASYSQELSVVGIFDGRVRVPFADVQSLHPVLVSILSHELAHALITEYTGDRAPKWFHEGLAEHVQMVQDSVNPIPDLAAVSRVLSFPLIESVLTGFAAEQYVDLAYREAAWVVHFVEARWGVEGIHRLLDAFAAGADTGGALKRAFGLEAEAFERAAWEWCKSEAPASWPTEVVRYDQEINPYVKSAAFEAALPSRPDVPRVGRVEKPPEADVKSQMPAKMKGWHAVYAERTRPVKMALGPVVQAFRGRAQGDVGASCRQLREVLDELFLEPEVFTSPDRRAGEALWNAYVHFLELAKACRQGEDARVHAELAKAEQELGKAAKMLSAYGLSP